MGDGHNDHYDVLLKKNYKQKQQEINKKYNAKTTKVEPLVSVFELGVTKINAIEKNEKVSKQKRQ